MATATARFRLPTSPTVTSSSPKRREKPSVPARNLRTPPGPTFRAVAVETSSALPETRRPEKKLPRAEANALPEFLDDVENEPRGMAGYVAWSKEMIASGGGGPPRWFTPLECGGRGCSGVDGAPLLLYLPGIDGIGMGLIRHHQKLKKMFDVWCLHIPVMDRTPFEGLVEYVEKTLRSENVNSQNRPIYLVGESLGACLGFAVAARNPDVDLMILLANPATSFHKSPLQSVLSVSEAMPEPLNSMMSQLLSFTGNSSGMRVTYAEQDLQQTFRVLPESDTLMFSYISFLADILPRKSLIWKLKMLKSASLFTNSRLHAVRAQMLILASGRDQLFPSSEEAERICSLMPNCRIRLFKDSGHTIFLESDVDLVTVIKGAGFYRRSGEVNYVSDYLAPTSKEFQNLAEQYRLLIAATSSVLLSTLESGKIVRGLAGIPSEGPVVLVGYHSLMGWDTAPMVIEFFKKNILLRGLAHPFLFDRNSEQLMPDSSSFDHMRIMGAVPVTSKNFYRLLSEKSFVLLYPGGAREALHKKGEQYKLFWPEKPEFVRMAAKFGATIIPFGVAGEDDICELLIDYDDLTKIPFYNKISERINQDSVRLRTDSSGETANQVLHLPGMLPKLPGRFYYLFGRPIETKGRKEELKDRERSQELYLHVKSEVECCIAYLKEMRERDPYRNMLPRLIYQATHGFSSEVPTFEL